jgi:PqqD family protein of HPr-rel-A system
MWRVIPGQALQYRVWDDEFVLYNNLSGDTHLLGANAIHVLLAMQHTAADEEALITSLCHSSGAERDEESLDQVAQLLADLQSLALIEPIVC